MADLHGGRAVGERGPQLGTVPSMGQLVEMPHDGLPLVSGIRLIHKGLATRRDQRIASRPGEGGAGYAPVA